MGREKYITATAVVVNVITILITVFHKITFKSEIFGSCLMTGIPFIISLLLLFGLKGKKFGEKEKILLALSYGIAYIVVFRWIVVLLMLS